MCRDCEYGDYRFMNNEVSPYEVIDNSINSVCLNAIRDGYKEWLRDWVQDTASEYFDTGDWKDDEWEAWEDYLKDYVI